MELSNQPPELPVVAPIAPPVAETPKPAAPVEIPATLDDFKKVKLMVAQIKEVKEHPNADKLYVIQVDTGPGGLRQIVAGIRKSYTPEQLVGKRIILVANLAPAVLRGEVSNGMLLAASDEHGSSLLTPDRDAALGSLVK